MKKVIVILTQPVENNTSSMIRSMSLINELAIFLLSIFFNKTPFSFSFIYSSRLLTLFVITGVPQVMLSYNNGNANLPNVVIKRYGHRKKIQVSCKDVKEAKGMKKKLIANYIW